MSEDIEIAVVRGSGNVFHDLGEPDAKVLQLKAILAGNILHVLDARKLTVRAAAVLTGFAAADFSRVRQAKVQGFTLDKMVAMLGRLDQDVELSVRIHPREPIARSSLA